jgi:hypothetical protein
MSKKITENGEGIPVLLTLIDRVSEFIHVFQEDWDMWMLCHICHIPSVYLHHDVFQVHKDY